MRANAILLSSAPLIAIFSTVSSESLLPRDLPAKGGWSLQMEIGGSCPSGTATCFSDQTGVSSEFNRTGVEGTFSRGEECCPFGTTPRLDCGTYVNNGQPYACCPLGNADCRGDVEDPYRKGNELCANPGWALWQIPDGGFNMFCCLPNQYGYWYPHLGQDAVGMCSSSSILPDESLPGVQFNNGDGSVSPAGVQLTPLPSPPPPPAPLCSTTHYGWSFQTPNQNKVCPSASHLCPNTSSCCPSGLTCGTVIGDSEVPVCCPPSNPDCRGDVEGLWPQLCAESGWALWHVNTNGNHFCCPPNSVGYNVPNDNAATGMCGDRVRNSTMRSILDYVGDGSEAGSFDRFPCDSTPSPNASFPVMVDEILNPPKNLNLPGSLNPSASLPTGKWENVTFSAAGGATLVGISSKFDEITCTGSKTEMTAGSYGTQAPQGPNQVLESSRGGMAAKETSTAAGEVHANPSGAPMANTEIAGGSYGTHAPQTGNHVLEPLRDGMTAQETNTAAGEVNFNPSSAPITKTETAGGSYVTHAPQRENQVVESSREGTMPKETGMVAGEVKTNPSGTPMASTGTGVRIASPITFTGSASALTRSLLALVFWTGGLIGILAL